MANQPKKYKKFVATAATATLVASAIVPVASAASFTDVADNTHAEAINALVDAGIINGYPDGTFKPNATLTRGHVVKMLGKWVEAQGFEVPADWNTVARFTDLAVDASDQELVKYAAVVKDSGVFNGSNGALNSSGSMTRENMALVLDRAYKAIFGQSLVEEAADLEDVTVADLLTAREETREAIQALRNLGISVVDNFNPRGTVTRGQFASFLNRTINVEGQTPTTPEPAEVEIASVKTTGATQLTVEFNKAVDTNAAEFELKRGNTVIKIVDVDFNEAGTVAVIELENRFAAATYNLTVTGVSEKALTASVTTTKEVASEIKFNSNKLVLTGQKDGKGNVLATITFEVYNQYGEIITDSVATSKYKKPKLKGIKSDDPTIKEKGILTVWVDDREDDGEIGTLEFTYEDGDLEIDVTQDVELSDEIEAGAVTIKGIHSKAGYEFTAANVEKVADTNDNIRKGEPTDDFVLLFEVKDQFGAPINPDKVFDGTQKQFEATSASTANVKITSLEQIVDGLRFDVSNKDIFDIEDDLEYVEILNVDGKYYFAAHLSFEFDGKYVEETGENTVTIRSKATGNEASSKITLANSTKVHSVSLSAPTDTVAGNEDVYIPVEVKDQDGEKIVNVARLNELVRDKEILVTLKGAVEDDERYTFVARDGEVFLKTKTDDVTDEDGKDLEVSIEVDTSGEESEIEFTVEKNAYADRIARVNGVKAVYYDRDYTIGLDDLVIEDQYGRVFDKLTDDYEVEVTVKSGGKFDVISSGDTAVISKSNEIKLKPIGGSNNLGSSSIQFDLKVKNESVSKLNVTYRSVDEGNFTSYKIEGPDLIKGSGESNIDVVDFKHNVKVFGITGSGEKVRLSGSAFSVLSNPYLTTTSADSSKVFVTQDAKTALEDASGENTLDTSYTVIISKTGEAVNRAVKVSDAKRKVVSIGFEDVESATDAPLTSTEFELTFTAGKASLSASQLIAQLEKDADITFADQYGFEDGEGPTDLQLIEANGGYAVLFNGSTTGGAPTTAGVAITLSNISNEDVKVTGNGRSDILEVTGLEVNDSFVLTLSVNGVSQSVLVHVIEDK